MSAAGLEPDDMTVIPPDLEFAMLMIMALPDRRDEEIIRIGDYCIESMIPESSPFGMDMMISIADLKTMAGWR